MQDENGRLYGRDYEVAMALSETLNFKPVFIQPSDGKLIASNEHVY